MDEYQFDLSVGDVLSLGDCLVTVVDIDGPHVSFRIDRDDDLVSTAWGETRFDANPLHESH